MRLDLSFFKYLNKDDFRVLTAIEMGMRNHEVVPVNLIQSISKIRTTNVRQIIANLLKHKLIKHTNVIYDGYSLNYLGYDYLAIHSLIKQGILFKIGSKIGVGKESDVYLCYVKSINSEISDEQYNEIKQNLLENYKEEDENEEDEKEEEENEEEEEEEKSYFQNNLPANLPMKLEGDLTIACIKLARLGRTSFRAVKNKRDYVKQQTHYNWLYLSRLSAQNEYKNMKGLFSKGFSVPRPYGYNRHCIIMEYIPSYPLNRVEEIKDKDVVYHKLMDFILKLGNNGLVHGDFNEFNLLLSIKDINEIYVIDFPQMISIDHEEAENYFKRDVQCIKNFFKKKFNVLFDDELHFSDIKRIDNLDVELKAFGYKKQNKIGKNLKEKEDIKEEEEEDENEEENKEDDLKLDYEKEMKENLKKVEMKDKTNEKEENKKTKLNEEDIKNKVKKMLNKQNKINLKGGKIGNRFKGKKNALNNIDLKNI